MIPGSTAFPWPMVGGFALAVAASAGAAYLVRGTKEAAQSAALGTGIALGAWEAGWWMYRWNRRRQVYAQAVAEATRLGRPLVVVGAPDGGVTSGYGCGNYTIDLSQSDCPNWLPLDITKPLPFADDSTVVFCSCVLEYVSDPMGAVAELKRISGGHIHFVGVEPWTLAALLYPGARQTLPAAYR
jgi:hypothetical protein